MNQVEIVTNHGEMKEILEKAKMRGTDTDGEKVSLVGDAILSFDEEENRVQVKVFDGMRSVWGNIRRQFGDIRTGGDLVIGDIKDFLKYLDRFGEEVTIEQRETETEERLFFSDQSGKRGSIPATDEDHIASADRVDELPFEYDEEKEVPIRGQDNPIEPYFKTEASEIQSIIEDGDTTQVREYPITLEDGEVEVRVGDDEGWIENTINAEGEGVSASLYAYGMDNVFSQLSGEVKVHIMQDGAMWVHQDREVWTIDYMIAEKSE